MKTKMPTVKPQFFTYVRRHHRTEYATKQLSTHEGYLEPPCYIEQTRPIHHNNSASVWYSMRRCKTQLRKPQMILYYMIHIQVWCNANQPCNSSCEKSKRWESLLVVVVWFYFDSFIESVSVSSHLKAQAVALGIFLLRLIWHKFCFETR